MPEVQEADGNGQSPQGTVVSLVQWLSWGLPPWALRRPPTVPQVLLSSASLLLCDLLQGQSLFLGLVTSASSAKCWH